MHSLGKRGVMAALLIALGTAAAMPSTALAGPEPGAKRGTRTRLFARSLGALTVNRVYYGLSNEGAVGVDSTNSSTIGGGFWPRGTANQYMFKSGLQIAGVIQGQKPANPWGGDTTGGFFFDPKGTTEHGIGVTDIWNATSLSDVANWPAAGLVPQGDESEELFSELLRGRVSASQGDVWWVSWEGDPGLRAGRSHPLGIVAEYRGLGWNYPTGNNDILYFIITFYNITSLNPADYASYRPAIREILIQKAQDFHALNNATFGITLPTAGYTIDPFYAAFAADPDVGGDAGNNYSSVQLPLALGYTYERNFPRPPGWTFDPAIFGAPFFAGVGFVGIKYLKSPTGVGEIQLYSNTTNGATSAFPDPANTTRLFKYLSGTVTPADGVNCNQGVVTVSRICFVNPAQSDVRLIQSSTPLALPPGGSGSIVVAYVHAAPVAIPGYVSGTNVDPGNPRRWESAATLAAGANRIDSISGFAGYSDGNGDGVVQQDEVRFVQGSMIGKALTAQFIFDSKFLLPFAPDAPEFFLIPGNNTVTVLWKPSAAEAEGDAYFQISNSPTVVPPGGGAPVANPLYDPNYRKFDVEGYRVYRGRVDSPNSLRLLAQFDYNGTTFRDFRGRVVQGGGVEQLNCAPEINVTTGCLVTYTPPTPGVPAINSRAFDLSGQFVQAVSRTQLASLGIITLEADSAVTGAASGQFPELSNSGVPFVFVDTDVVNGLTYYYAVTAFDVNSRASGPSSLESARATKRVVPNTVSGNYVNTGTVSLQIEGRGRNMSTAIPADPTLDTEGRFSGPQRPADGGVLGFVGAFVKEVVTSSGSVRARLDSLKAGQHDLSGCCAAGATAIPARYFFTVSTAGGEFKLTIPVTPDLGHDVESNSLFKAVDADQERATRYGGGAGYALQGQFTFRFPVGPDNGFWGIGVALGEPGYTADDRPTGTTGIRYNGERWFDGANETEPDPTKGACGTGTGACASNPVLSRADFSNAGKLTGVTSIYVPRDYTMFDREWRNISSVLATIRRAADFKVYWGAAGKIDSIIDATHNVVVPFQANVANGGWGILNTSATNVAGTFDNRPTVLTPTDWTCVEPLRSQTTQANFAGFFSCTAPAFTLSQTAELGAIAYHAGSAQSTTSATSLRNPANIRPQGGFSLIIAGSITFFEMPTLPAQGTVWTLRNYSGIIYGGDGGTQDGGAGNNGRYAFRSSIRPFTAIGAEVVASYTVTNEVVATTAASLDRVHTVPDPYYVTSAYEATTTAKVIKFVNLPEKATIRIYTTSGVLVRVLKQDTGSFSGELNWDVRNRNNQFVASGVYFYHVTAENGAEKVGRMTIVNYAQ